jgi:acetyl esterase/lipase
MTRILFGSILAFGLVAMSLPAQDTKKDEKQDEKKVAKKPPMPSIPPTHGNVSYGKHERNVMDFWQAKSDKPTPIVICIHGGSWIAGDKSTYYSRVKTYLDAGISMATINYRLMKQANEEKVVPPVKAPLEDAARAVQFVRSKASEWNIDKKRLGATGGSAGGASTLWLAFHDDMADPASSDPVARESTRLYCAATDGAQTSLDPKDLLEWMPNYTYGAHAFGLKSIKEMVAQRETIQPWLKKYSAIEHVTKDDPPIGLYYGGEKGAKRGENHKDPTMLGLLLAEKLKQVGVEHVMVWVDQPNEKLPNANAFLIEYLRK